MQVNIQPNGQEYTVQLIGELDTMATTEQADELRQVLNIADKALLIDCSEMEYISSAGLRFFMQLKREEALAIRWHMGFSGQEDSSYVGQGFAAAPLAVALSVADEEATFFMEKQV